MYSERHLPNGKSLRTELEGLALDPEICYVFDLDYISVYETRCVLYESLRKIQWACGLVHSFGRAIQPYQEKLSENRLHGPVTSAPRATFIRLPLHTDCVQPHGVHL